MICSMHFLLVFIFRKQSLQHEIINTLHTWKFRVNITNKISFDFRRTSNMKNVWSSLSLQRHVEERTIKYIRSVLKIDFSSQLTLSFSRSLSLFLSFLLPGFCLPAQDGVRIKKKTPTPIPRKHREFATGARLIQSSEGFSTHPFSRESIYLIRAYECIYTFIYVLLLL